ncbi:MAG: chorismate mutase [Dysosmobacter sp.]
MELSDYRARIDQIDRQLVELFAQRMNTAAGIAAYKKGARPAGAGPCPGAGKAAGCSGTGPGGYAGLHRLSLHHAV